MTRNTSNTRKRARDIGKSLSKAFGGVKVIDSSKLKPAVLSSGVASVDVATGIGGYPEGRFIILHGAEASGKSTLALHAVAECQKAGGVVIYLDFEHKLDLGYAEALGVDVESMVLAGPPYIEKGFELLVAAAEKIRQDDTETPILFVWDSLQAAISRRSFDGDYDKEQFSPEAGAYARGFAKFIPKLSEVGAILIGISQVRMDLGGFMAKEKVAVGKAPLFYASIIMRIKAKRARGATKGAGEREAIEVQMIKNQVGTPYQIAKFDIIYGLGVDKVVATVEAADALGLLKKGKSGWFEFELDGKTHKAQGSAGLAKIAAESPQVFDGLLSLIRDNTGSVTGDGEVIG